MPKLTPIKWKKFEKFLLYAGCVFKRQKGDHRIYWRKDLKRPIVLPMYDSLPKFIILNNLRTLGIKVEEYLEILKKI
jgi:predicted RNA binding protein YcfA (HicA-like mRNA interferase family)